MTIFDNDQEALLALRLLAAADVCDISLKKGSVGCEWYIAFELKGNLTFPRGPSEETTEQRELAFQTARDLLDYVEKADEIYRRYNALRLDDDFFSGGNQW